MAFYDGFLDRLAEAVDELEEQRRTGGKLRLAGEETRNTRFRAPRAFAKKKEDNDELGDLVRYDGLYKEPERPEPMQTRASIYTEEDEPRGYEFSEVRGSSKRPGGATRRRDPYAEQERRYRPPVRSGHVFDDIEDDEAAGAYYEAEYERYMRTRKKPKKSRVGRKLVFLLIATAAIVTQIIIFASLKGDRPSSITSADMAPEVTYNAVTSDGNAVPLTADELMKIEAENIVSGMSLEEKVGQLLLVRSHGAGTKDFGELISSCHAGGVVLFAEDFKGKSADEVRAMTAALQEAGGGSLLVCVDEEGGTVVRVSSNPRLRAKKFRSPQNVYILGGMEGVRNDALEKSELLLSLGINVNLAPVADVVTNTRAYMYDRAFGKGAEDTAEYVRTVVTAMEEKGIGSVLKHFPGYGNTSGDTHNGLVVLDTAETVVFERDLLPFKAGIEAGADAVLISHTIVKAVDDQRPASLSDSVVALLRADVGFDGVIMCDALDMDAIKEYSGGDDVCVAAVRAGIDLLCTPSDPQLSWSTLCSAVRDGTLTEHEIDEAATRVVLWKLRMGVMSSEG